MSVRPGRGALSSAGKEMYETVGVMYGWTPESTAEVDGEVVEEVTEEEWEDDEGPDCAVFHGHIIE